MKCHHYCNTMRCPECARRFWKWAENHTRRSDFYVRAAMNIAPGLVPVESRSVSRIG